MLRPEATAVRRFLAAPSDAAWRDFAEAYRRTLGQRFASEREAFDALAQAAREGDLWLGCNCPTMANPDVRRCHTWLALEFLAAAYPDLEVVWPA